MSPTRQAATCRHLVLWRAQFPFFGQRRREAQSLWKVSRSPGERGTGSRQQLHCQPRRCAPVTTYRGRWASLHPSGSESTSPLSTPPKIKCGLTSERRRVSAARGLTGTPISTSSAPLPASGRLDLEAALPAPRQRPHTAALQTRGGPRSQENTEAAHLGSATASSKRPEVWVKRGIKK